MNGRMMSDRRESATPDPILLRKVKLWADETIRILEEKVRSLSMLCDEYERTIHQLEEEVKELEEEIGDRNENDERHGSAYC
jgi:prefoldin subunit 5